MSRAQGQTGDEPVTDILARLWDRTEHLVKQELALGLAEIDRRTEEAGDGLKRAAIAGAVAFAGALALLAAVILLLGQVMPLWAAATVVGVLTSSAGYALIKSVTVDASRTAKRAAERREQGTESFKRNEARHDAA